MRTTIISIIAVILAASCQQEPLQVMVEKEYDDLESISFQVDTITYGDSIRVMANFKRHLFDDAKMTFIKLDDKEQIIEHLLFPARDMRDSLVMKPYTLAVGTHSISFHVCCGYQSRSEEIEFFVRPVSTDFLEVGGAYFYSGTTYSSHYKLDIPESDRIDIPLGSEHSVALLTGINSSNAASHGLNPNMFNAWIESDGFIADYEGLKVENLKYYFHNYNTDKGECYAITTTLYPLLKGDGDIVIEFCGRTRRIPIRITDPKDIVKL